MNNNKLKLITTVDLERIYQTPIEIDLSHNRIETIIYSRISHPEHFTYYFNIDLSDNPINCDCKILDFVRHLTDENDDEITLKNPKNTTCSEPKLLENQVLSQIDKFKLFCDLDTEASGVKLCPENCRCLRRTEDDTLEMSCEMITNVTIFPNVNETLFKSIELTVENTSLQALSSLESDGGYKDITKLFLGGNEISRVKLQNLPPHLTLLSLENNKLSTLDDDVIDFLGNMTTLTHLTLRLSGNPWSCECDDLKFLAFVHSHARSITDYKDLQCADEKYFDLQATFDLCNYKHETYIYISIATAFTGLVLGGLAAFYYRYQKQIKMWLHAHNFAFGSSLKKS